MLFSECFSSFLLDVAPPTDWLSAVETFSFPLLCGSSGHSEGSALRGGEETMNMPGVLFRESCCLGLRWHWGPGWTSSDPHKPRWAALALCAEKFPDSADLQRRFRWLKKRSERRLCRWKGALPLCTAQVLGITHRRQAAWDTWRMLSARPRSLFPPSLTLFPSVAEQDTGGWLT